MTKLTKTKKIFLAGAVALVGLGVVNPLASASDTNSQTDSTANIEFNVNQIKEKLASQIGNGKITEISLKDKKFKGQNNDTTKTPVFKVDVIDGNVKKEFKIDANSGEIKETKERQMSDNDKDKVLANENPTLSLEDATKKALEKYSNGKIKEVELEKRTDEIVYEIDIIDDTTFHKLTLDANSGEILNDTTKQKGGKHRDKRNSKDRNFEKNNNQENK